MTKVYIIVGNDGFPRFADEECTKLQVAKSLEAALDTAKDLVKASPYVVFGVYALEASVFSDGQNEIVVPSDGNQGKN
jgi:hypothetical protein